jgi:hypothetical protein
MAVLWRCAVVSLVVALAYQPFTVQTAGPGFSWWDLLYGIFTSWAWAASFLEQAAILFPILLLTSWLSVTWIRRSAPEVEGKGPNASMLSRLGGKQGAWYALGRIALVCLAVALIAPAITMPLAASGLEERPVPSFPDSPGGEIRPHFEPWEHWWERFLYPFQLRGAWRFYLEASGVVFVLGVLGSLVSVGWVGWKGGVTNKPLPKGHPL